MRKEKWICLNEKWAAQRCPSRHIAAWRFLFLIPHFLFLMPHSATAQTFNEIDESGNITQRDETSRLFNPYSTDSTSSSKEVPRGIYVWTVDRKFGDITRAEVDTLPHLYPQSTMATGRYLQYNTIGSNYTARQNRIFTDRPVMSEFYFTDAYDQVVRTPDQRHFTNTLSPITNLSYGSCGDKTNGEDLLDARFAANLNKRFGFGFDLNYLYARGYYQNQSTSHFDATFYASYLGDKYQAHVIYTNYHQKASENGGISDDNYVTHPERSSENYADNEIPTILSQNWNRNNQQHFFLTHRYALGFYRKVKMTEEEMKARKFAEESKAEKEAKTKLRKGEKEAVKEEPKFMGRPKDAVIVGDAPPLPADSAAVDTTRIKVDSKEMADSLLAAEPEPAPEADDPSMKKEFVPVTSFIHTLDLGHYDHIYQAYDTPRDYYATTYYNNMWHGYSNDSIYDQTKLLDIKNTLAIALLEGFNKYASAGLKGFVTHHLRRYDMPELDTAYVAYMSRWNEHNVSIGGQLQRTQGHTLHYNVLAETWLTGEDAGQLKLEGQTDLNFPLFGDTMRLAARAHFYRLNPSFVERRYHSKHLWWDNDLDKETRTRIEGSFRYEKTNTTLRVAVEEIQNYTYLGMSNTYADEAKKGLTAAIRQYGSNLNVVTAQLDQKMRLGPLHWDNIVTYQTSSSQDVLPLPKLNVFSNLYLQFMVARVLLVELGGAATWYTKYDAPDFCPQLNQFAVQENAESRVELGNFPFVDIYANLHLKHARFFIMMSNATGKEFNRLSFVTPHYPLNRSVLHLGVSWNFFN